MCQSLLQCVSHVCNAVLQYVIIRTKSLLQCVSHVCNAVLQYVIIRTKSRLQYVSHSCTDMPLANTKQLCHTSSVNEWVWLRMSYVTRMIQASHSTTILSSALICHSHKASSIWHVIHCVISTNMLSLSPANMQIGPICHAYDMSFIMLLAPTC